MMDESIKKTQRELDLNDQPIEEHQLYSIALSKYHFMNISDFMDISLEETKKNALPRPRVLATSSRDIVEEYMMVTPHLCREVEGRLIVVD